jgi:hypothetical protein
MSGVRPEPRLRGSGRVGAAVAVLAAASLLATGGSLAARRAPAAGPPACTDATRRVAAQPVVTARLDDLAPPATGVAVPADCVPEAVFLAPFAGRLGLSAEAFRAAGTAQPVVMPSGDAYALLPGGAGGADHLTELSPSGKVLWTGPPAPDAASVTGDAQIVVAAGPIQAQILNPATHAVTDVPMPYAALSQSGRAASNFTADVVGGLAILETSLYNTMGGEQPPTAGEAVVYDAAGMKLRQFTLPDQPVVAQPDVAFDGVVMQTVGNTAYLLYSSEPSGDHAGLYTLTAQDRFSGPYPVQAPFTDSSEGGLAVLPGPSILVDSWGQNGGSAALYRLAGGSLRPVWSRDLGLDTALVDGGTYLAEVSTPSLARRMGPGPSTLRLLNWRTGRPLRGTRPLRDQHMYLQVLAASPAGVVATANSTAVPCANACFADLVFIEPDGHRAWSLPLPPPLSPLSAPITAEPVTLHGHPAILLGPSGLAVTWGGGRAVPPAAWPAFARPVATAPPPPPRGPARAYAVFDQGTEVDAAHPLAVSAAQVGQPISLEVSPVSAAGAAIAAVAEAGVALGDGSAGGQIRSDQGFGQALFEPGQTAVPFTFTPAAPGTYALTATPGGFGTDASDIPPTPPALVPVGRSVRVDVVPWDPNGVLYPLPSGVTVQVAVSSGARSDVGEVPANASLGRDGFYTSTLRSGAAPDRLVQLTTTFWVGGQPWGDGAGTSAMAIVNAPPPRLQTAAAAGGGVRLTLSPAAGTRPIGYAVYRVAANAAPPGSAAGVPLAVIDPLSAADPGATWTDPAGGTSDRYAVAAIYADGAVSPLSAAVRP